MLVKIGKIKERFEIPKKLNLYSGRITSTCDFLWGKKKKGRHFFQVPGIPSHNFSTTATLGITTGPKQSFENVTQNIKALAYNW